MIILFLISILSIIIVVYIIKNTYFEKRSTYKDGEGYVNTYHNKAAIKLWHFILIVMLGLIPILSQILFVLFLFFYWINNDNGFYYHNEKIKQNRFIKFMNKKLF